MLQLAAGGPLVERRFFVDFSLDITSADYWLTYTLNQTLGTPVPLDRTLVRRVNQLAGRADGGGSGVYWVISDGGVWLTSSTNLRLVYVGQYHTSPLTGMIFRAEIIVLKAKPKSLQNVVGNAAAAQTIGLVDPSRAMIFDAMCRMPNSHGNTYPTGISANQVTWSNSLTANDRYQVAEF
ncbi:MAG: hypothetical protein HY910_12155 [Desulfarculus sp.]|nr:hypothetical protein [Desulfarculus sp.]